MGIRVLVVGAGPVGAATIRQLQKNPHLEIVTLDAGERPFAVEEGVVSHIDIQEVLTPLSLDFVLAQARPDLILWTIATEDLALGHAPGIDVLGQALREEIASISEVPVIEVARGV